MWAERDWKRDWVEDQYGVREAGGESVWDSWGKHLNNQSLKPEEFLQNLKGNKMVLGLRFSKSLSVM